MGNYAPDLESAQGPYDPYCHAQEAEARAEKAEAALLASRDTIIHACPSGDSAQTPCGLFPMEHVMERLTVQPDLITCPACLHAALAKAREEIADLTVAATTEAQNHRIIRAHYREEIAQAERRGVSEEYHLEHTRAALRVGEQRGLEMAAKILEDSGDMEAQAWAEFVRAKIAKLPETGRAKETGGRG